MDMMDWLLDIRVKYIKTIILVTIQNQPHLNN